MLTLNPAYRETLRMAYRCLREQDGPQWILEKFKVGLGVIEAPVEMQLGISVRCVLKTLYTFDVFGEYLCALRTVYPKMISISTSCFGGRQVAIFGVPVR